MKTLTITSKTRISIIITMGEIVIQIALRQNAFVAFETRLFCEFIPVVKAIYFSIAKLKIQNQTVTIALKHSIAEFIVITIRCANHMQLKAFIINTD